MRLIQVGVGGFGHGWLQIVRKGPSVNLVAVADLEDEALAAAREETGLTDGQCFADYREAFRQVEADAVLCVTPPAVHHRVALAAFEQGLHCLTEKPLSDTMERASRMVEAADRADRALMVSQNYRFRSWVRTIRYLLESEEFGAPDSALVRFAKAPRFARSFRLKMEHPLVRDMSIHHFDLMRAVSGREPVSVYAETWRPAWSWFEHDPCAVALFDFEDGFRFVYHGSWVTRRPETTWAGEWAVECPRAAVELRDDRVHIVPAEHPEQDTEVELQKMPCEGQEFALGEFTQAIEEGREPETSGRDNLKSLAMVFATTESARRGERVYIKEILPA